MRCTLFVVDSENKQVSNTCKIWPHAYCSTFISVNTLRPLLTDHGATQLHSPPLIVDYGGCLPNNLTHSVIQSLSSLHVTTGPSIGSLNSTVTSYSVIVISPTQRWKLDVSDLHLSVKVVNDGWSSPTYLNWEWMKNPARLTQFMTRGSSKFHFWYRGSKRSP